MIIVNIIGGLANQMVCYAAGRSLAEYQKTELLLDTRFYRDFGSCTQRTYELDKLNISAPIATDEQIEALTGRPPSVKGYLYTKAQKCLPYYRRALFKERSVAFDKNFFRTGSNVYLKGNFASCHYWQGVEEILKHEFSLKTPYSQKSAQWLSIIKQKDFSVAVHVRRGDYVHNENANNFHGLIGLEYYEKAMGKLMDQSLNKAHFFLFSDDPEWVANNFRGSYPMTIVSENEPSLFHEHLFLISECAHQIIANSGFSLWGAYLNKNPEKIVVAPRQWVRDPAKNEMISCVPESWLRL